MQNEMIYLSNDELKVRLINSRRDTNKIPKDPMQSPAARSAEVLYAQLLYFLGTDRQEYYVQSWLRHTKFTIQEKMHEQEFPKSE